MTKVFIFLFATLLIILTVFVVVFHDQIADKWDELTGTPELVYEDVPEVTGREVFDAWDKALTEMEESKKESESAKK